MKVERLWKSPNGHDFSLSHTSYSPALNASIRVIPGLYKGKGNEVIGAADAIEAAVKYLIEERGLNAEAFEGLELLETPKWDEHE